MAAKQQGPHTPHAALSRPEAEAAFRAYVDSEPERLDAFRRAVAERGGPGRDVLELTRESLGPLGAWLVEAAWQQGPQEGERPLWARRDLTGGPLEGLSTDSLWLLDGAATYFAATLQRAHPGLRWTLVVNKRDTDHHRPVLAGFGSMNLWPVTPVLVKLNHARAATPVNDAWMVELFDVWSRYVPAGEPAPSDDGDDLPIDDVEVSPLEDDDPRAPDWNVEIYIPEYAEQVLGEAEFDRLADRLGAIAGIEELLWEDRELFLARTAPGTDLEWLRAQVAEAMRQAAQAAQAARAAASRD